MSFARAKLSSSVGTGPTRFAERVAGGIAAHRAVRLERVERRHAEELEVVERLQVGAMDHRGALRLQAEGDAGPGEPRAVVGDERHVGDAPHPDDARCRASLADPVADRVEHLAVLELRDRPADPVRERRSDRDHDLGRVVTVARGSALVDDRLCCALLTEQLGRSHHLRQRLQELPALALQAIAGARAGVLVRIVHRRQTRSRRRR